MTNLFLFIGVGLAFLYSVLLYVNKGGGRGGGVYYACMISFLIHIFLSTRNILRVIIAVPLFIIAGFILAAIVGYVRKAATQ